ncbi:MAG: hypothetical protein ACR2OZ_19765 [Verrucomicrobiales bacterium]
MKKALLLLGAALAVNLAVPADSSAAQRSRDVRRVVDRCDRCDQAVFAQRYVAGYTRKGNPIYRWKTLAHRHSHNRYAQPRSGRDYYARRDWDGYERDMYVRDRYDPRWRERQYRTSPNYLQIPGMSIRLRD